MSKFTKSARLLTMLSSRLYRMYSVSSAKNDHYMIYIRENRQNKTKRSGDIDVNVDIYEKIKSEKVTMDARESDRVL